MLLALLLMIVGSAFAQTEIGRISGVVRDPSGAIVPNVTVTATSVGKQTSQTVTTSANGAYQFLSLQPGTYEISVNAPGFQPFKQRVDVTVGSRNTVDIPLGVASAAATTVEVVAEGGATVNTTDQTLSQVVSSTQITQLPTLTRNPYDLIQTAGNVSPSSDSNVQANRGVGVSINGQRAASTNILLDGGENVNLFDTTVGTTVPLDSVQEFRVVTSDFTAEYGRASGGVVNVATRSGSNAFHGTAYEFNRISEFAANSFENNANDVPKPRFVRNQFGYSFGGPIIKNKLFFFNSNEWIRVRSSQSVPGLIPTSQLIAAADPNTQAFFNAFGATRSNLQVINTFTNLTPGLTPAALALKGSGARYASLAPGTPIFQQITFQVPGDSGGGSPQNSWLQNGRFDFNPSDRTAFFFRLGMDHGDLFPGTISNSPYVGYDTGQTNFNQNYLLNMTHTFNPSLVSQSKFSYNRLNLQQPLGTAPISPTLYIQETTPGTFQGQQIIFPGYLPTSPGNSIPFGGPQNLYQAYEDISWSRGNHSFRFGGSYIHTRDNRVFGAYETAVSNLASQGNIGEGLENFLAGQLFSFQSAVDPQGKFPCSVDVTGAPIVTPDCTVTLPVGPPKFSRNNRYNDWAYYIQDSWKVTPRLTLNLGIRHEYYGVQHNADDRLDSNFYYGPGATITDRIRTGQVFTVPNSPIGALWNADYNNIAPRVGFAWDVFGTGKTAIRGGYGIAYERNFGNVTFNVIQNPPNYAVLGLVAGVDVPTIPVPTDNAGPLAGTGTKALPRTQLRHVSQDIPTAYAHQYSAAVEQQLAGNALFAIEYSGSRGVKQYTLENINRPGTGVIYGGDDPAISGFSRLNSQYTNINSRNAHGDSYYNAMNLRFEANNLRQTGLSVRANYTWAHAIDNLSSTFSEASNNFNLGLLDPFNPGLDRGNAEFDVRHRVAISAVYETPFGKNMTGWKSELVGGWSIAPIFTAYTGFPFSIFDCTNAVQICPRAFTNQSLQLDNSNPGPQVGPNVYNYIPTPQDLAGVYLNPTFAGVDSDLPGGISDFGACGPGTAPGACIYPANMTRRNTFRGPGHWNLDLGVYKTFKVTEKLGLQLRAEAFNLMNHSNLFVLGETADVSSPFVQAKRGGGGNSTLGIAPGQDTREHRNLQLGVKLTF
jgi:outer membrane receptor protein involved in Fe transport